MNSDLKTLIDEYIKSIEKDLPPEILSKEIETLRDFQDWVDDNGLTVDVN
jgi:hypothetical protein